MCSIFVIDPYKYLRKFHQDRVNLDFLEFYPRTYLYPSSTKN